MAAIKKLPGGQFPPGSVFPHVRLSPSGPNVPGVPEIVQVGYDQPIEALAVSPPAGILGFFPRDALGNPMKVILPEVTPGNVLEVDWRLSVEMELDEYYPETLPIITAIGIVTFDGTDPSVTGTFFLINNCCASSALTDASGDEAASIWSLGTIAAVAIPDGATAATIELAYSSSVDFFVIGAGEKKEPLFLSAVLKASELNRAIVQQPGPGNLVAFP